MSSGILYVVFNEWIRNPETNEKPYKIGEKNHGKIFEQNGQNIYLWEKVKDIIWNKYREYTK
jgi:hypothetical protein